MTAATEPAPTCCKQLSATPDVKLVRHERNRGKGAAVSTGLHAAHDHGYTHAVQIDADGQHTVSDVRRFSTRRKPIPMP